MFLVQIRCTPQPTIRTWGDNDQAITQITALSERVLACAFLTSLGVITRSLDLSLLLKCELCGEAYQYVGKKRYGCQIERGTFRAGVLGRHRSFSPQP